MWGASLPPLDPPAPGGGAKIKHRHVAYQMKAHDLRNGFMVLKSDFGLNLALDAICFYFPFDERARASTRILVNFGIFGFLFIESTTFELES